MSTIKINVKVRSRTPLALLVFDGKTEVWIPHSMITSQTMDVVKTPGTLGEVITTIELPDWVAAEKGLQQVNQDVDTADMFGGEK